MKRLAATLLLAVFAMPVFAEDWPQWQGIKRDSVWNEKGIVDKFASDTTKPVWSAPIAGGFAGPAVANGLVYVPDYLTTDNVGKETFDRTDFSGKERLHCLDAKTGKPVWKYEYDCKYTVSYPIGPRCTPTVVDGKVYFLGTEGNFVCLDAKTGSEIWKKDFKKDYGAKTALWGYCSHPLVDGDTLYSVVGGEGSVVVAFDKNTGKELWKSLTAEEQGYSPPTMIEVGKTKQLLVWHATSVNSLDPKTGAKNWSVKIEAAYKLSIMSPRLEGNLLFVGGEGPGNAVMIELDETKPTAKELWRATKNNAVFPVNMTPFFEGGHVYGVNQTGVMFCVEAKTGKRVWESAKMFNDKPANCMTAFVVKNGDRFILFTEQGNVILCHLSPKGYEEISRTHIIDPTTTAFGRKVTWVHPAYADGHIFVRNDKEIICVSLKK